MCVSQGFGKGLTCAAVLRGLDVWFIRGDYKFIKGLGFEAYDHAPMSDCSSG